MWGVGLGMGSWAGSQDPNSNPQYSKGDVVCALLVGPLDGSRRGLQLEVRCTLWGVFVCTRCTVPAGSSGLWVLANGVWR